MTCANKKCGVLDTYITVLHKTPCNAFPLLLRLQRCKHSTPYLSV